MCPTVIDQHRGGIRIFLVDLQARGVCWTLLMMAMMVIVLILMMGGIRHSVRSRLGLRFGVGHGHEAVPASRKKGCVDFHRR